MRLRPLTEFLLLRRGLCFLLSGQPGQATGDLTRLAQQKWEEALQKVALVLQQLAAGWENVREAAIGLVRKALLAINADGWARPFITDSWQNFAAGLRALGVRSWKGGDFRNSVRQLGLASRANPDDSECLCLLAWALATCPEAGLRNGRRAAKLAQRAVRLVKVRENPDHVLLSVLAAALAAAGNYAHAAQRQEEAIGSLPKEDNRAYLRRLCGDSFRSLEMGLFWPYDPGSQGDAYDGLLRAYRRRLRLYRANKPFHLEEKRVKESN